MNILRKIVKIGLLALVLSFSAALVQAQTVNLTISNIKSSKGQVLVAVFKDQKGFKDENPSYKHRFPKTEISNGVMKVSFDLPAGTYGIALVDDENNNGKLEKNMIGIPKEGIAFSNFYLSGMSKPTFEDFKFVAKDPATNVQCKIRRF